MIEKDFTARAWIGTWITMPGLSTAARDKFGSNLRLTFEKDGSCVLKIRNQVLKAKWEIQGKKILIHGDQIETKGVFYLKQPSGELESFMLYSIEGYGVEFYSEKHVALQEAKRGRRDFAIEKRRREKERSLRRWEASLEADLSTCTLEFISLLKLYNFENFKPVEIKPEEKDLLEEKYFKPILSLGLQHSSWKYSYKEDANRILKGYETYEFNLKLNPEKRKERDGEVLVVPYEEVKSYISARILVERDRLIDKLDDMLRRSPYYSREHKGFKMKISKDLDEHFQADLIEVWQKDKYLVIHMLYGSGEKDEDHAWFLLEGNSYADNYTYLGGSTFEKTGKITKKFNRI